MAESPRKISEDTYTEAGKEGKAFGNTSSSTSRVLGRSPWLPSTLTPCYLFLEAPVSFGFSLNHALSHPVPLPAMPCLYILCPSRYASKVCSVRSLPWVSHNWAGPSVFSVPLLTLAKQYSYLNVHLLPQTVTSLRAGIMPALPLHPQFLHTEGIQMMLDNLHKLNLKLGRGHLEANKK